MAKKITNEQIQQMVQLYAKLGTYSAVAKQLGISASTVSKYVKAQSQIKVYTNTVEAKPVEIIPIQELISFSSLTEEEKQSYAAWLKEFDR